MCDALVWRKHGDGCRVGESASVPNSYGCLRPAVAVDKRSTIAVFLKFYLLFIYIFTWLYYIATRAGCSVIAFSYLYRCFYHDSE